MSDCCDNVHTVICKGSTKEYGYSLNALAAVFPMSPVSLGLRVNFEMCVHGVYTVDLVLSWSNFCQQIVPRQWDMINNCSNCKGLNTFNMWQHFIIISRNSQSSALDTLHMIILPFIIKKYNKPLPINYMAIILVLFIKQIIKADSKKS